MPDGKKVVIGLGLFTVGLFGLAAFTGVIYAATRKAGIRLSNLIIEPSRIIFPGEIVSISVAATNYGNVSGMREIICYKNAEEVMKEAVVLEPSQSETITFNTTATEIGVYNISVNGLESTFEVFDAATGIRLNEGWNEIVWLGGYITIGEAFQSIKVYRPKTAIEGEYDAQYVQWWFDMFNRWIGKYDSEWVIPNDRHRVYVTQDCFLTGPFQRYGE